MPWAWSADESEVGDIRPQDPADVRRTIAELLGLYPDARVFAMDANGRGVPWPDTLPAAGPSLVEVETGLDLVHSSSRGTVLDGWRRFRQQGVLSTPVVLRDGAPGTLLAWDLYDDAGVGVVLLIGGADHDLTVEGAGAPLSSRFGRYRRDEVARVVGADQGSVEMLGWELEGIAAFDNPADLIHPDDRELSLANWIDVLGSPGVPRRWRGRHQKADGAWLWVEITNTNRVEDPDHHDVLSEMVDISEEMATMDSLRESEALLHLMAEALPNGVLQVSADRAVLYVNSRLKDLVGAPTGPAVDGHLGAIVEHDRAAIHDAIERALDAEVHSEFEVQVRLSGARTERVCELAVRAIVALDGSVRGALLCFVDVTDRVRLRRELQARADLDALTGCRNRAATMQGLAALVADEGWSGVAVLFVDLDRFKPINDDFGHAAGDDVLIAVAQRLQGLVRNEDFVGRLGGDEFLVVCSDLGSRPEALHIARRIIDELGRPVRIGTDLVTIDASVGIAWPGDRATGAKELVAAADAAMYRAKRLGGGQLVAADGRR